MNTREQLDETLELILGGNGRLLNLGKLAELLKQLIAERPYEPGEKIDLCTHPRDDWEHGRFYAVDPDDPNFIWVKPNRLPDLHRWELSRTRPLPKTYRVTVPEEVMESAKHGTDVDSDSSMWSALEVCKWLANPDNWEADND